MNNFEKLFPKNLYHSYIVEGHPHTVAFDLRKFLEKRGDIDIKSPDVLCEIYDSFTIDDSRFIKKWHSELRITNKKKVCILGIKFINNEAERALLKMIEEPANNTHFFLVVPSALSLLDTIRSRAHIIKVSESDNDLSKNRAKDFLKSNTKQRIEIVIKMIENNKNNEGNGGLRYNAIILINEIEKIIYQNFKMNKNNKEIIFVLNELQKSREYLSTSGASVKMILEHLALVV